MIFTDGDATSKRVNKVEICLGFATFWTIERGLLEVVATLVKISTILKSLFKNVSE
jgi:hypothetical protein